MRCLYCYKDLPTDRRYSDQNTCVHNNIWVQFSGTEDDIYGISFEEVWNGQVLKSILLSIDNEKTHFYNGMKPVLELDFLAEITPENMIKMFDRYTNLLVFL